MLGNHLTFKYIEFSSKPRNARLRLIANGFNPYGNMSSTHSTWLVILIPYNLAPWMCMKRSSFMLSLLILGPTSLENDIDVYLQPLVEELKKLWDVGVKMFGVSSEKSFKMHVTLLWIINDFPAYSDISVDNIIGTLLNLDGITNDNLKGHQDLKDMGIRSELHLEKVGNDQTRMPHAFYHMNASENDGCLHVLKDVRVLDGYSSNISCCVKLKEREIREMKSHDNHILMQQLFPIAIRGSLPPEMSRPLIDLSCFFREICSKVLNVKELGALGKRIAVTLCEL
ncbi:hypothetical protein SO802_021940 [Lithocarpus litseifolius]|uniref:Protein kinase A anchor protein nuclear localisation signal domain-containing protein n=1 Tax=Lithocarpus litseifolius TaxID=425828 RepID=A0AAW2CG76_9ROSI